MANGSSQSKKGLVAAGIDSVKEVIERHHDSDDESGTVWLVLVPIAVSVLLYEGCVLLRDSHKGRV